ncbi:AAA family ATPase [Aeromicrobium piscarium]|uniref:AAA family ATPase n=2 Tax=Aeromicrobium piscarium TaxID=2590901 RepID=A0A554RVN1_9ACTN|nr:AAA family ATPase [Aeromicrobium piscarium]
MRVMSAGSGYKYLLKSVVAGDGDRSLSTPLTRYYAEAGNPPGFWMGSGLAAFGDGQLTIGAQVSESQLQLLIGMGCDPITGDPLGRAYQRFASVAERVERRIADLDPALSAGERSEQVAQIETEETKRGTRRAVAGFDYTFSVPKSVSVLWAVADVGTQALIADAHHSATAEVIEFLEREVATTRVGATGPDGAVAHVDVAGVAATAFDHYDSRSADPQLHTHVVISNKVMTVQDGCWRTLAGRPMHQAVVALSELYNAVLADHLTRNLGVAWEQRDRGRDRNRAWEIVGVSEELVDEFSTRSRHIEVEKDRLIADYAHQHGRQPSARMVLKLRAQATLATRPDKQVRSLADLTAEWRQRATRVLGQDATGWARTVITGNDPVVVLRTDDVPLDVVGDVGQAVVEAVGERRSTWQRWNLMAEASRQVMGWRFASTADREAITGMIADAAEQASLRLTPPELASSPIRFQRADGTTRFRPQHSTVFSAEHLLKAEDRLLDRANNTAGPTVDLKTVEQFSSRPDREGRRLGNDQAAALSAIALSGRAIDVLVGPAGAGKTTAMSALRRAWEKQHGPGSVVGLAPSAVAADVLGDELGIETENTAKWWQSHIMYGTTFQAGQLVIIDEASLAGTMSLDRISGLAADAGAKVLLVGDYGQLQSVDAGGAFAMLVHDRSDAPELTDVHRFTHGWEKITSLQLRHGRPEAIDALIKRGRVTGGEEEDMIDAAYTAWRHDIQAGRASILVAETHQIVTALNQRARVDLILGGTIDPARELALRDGTGVSEGDTIITRHNDRRLRNRRTWVRNGDRWTVTRIREDGSMMIRPVGRRFGGGIVLPADYVAEHVDLGYAVTAHRAQGITTDTAHTVVTRTTTRENFYVAMTRGADRNHAYVGVDREDHEHLEPPIGDGPEQMARAALYGVLDHIGAELSAHETITAEHERWGSIAELAAEYETIAQAAQHDRWASLLAESNLTDDQVADVLASDAYGALSAELRRAEANSYHLDRLFPRLVAARGFADAADVASVLHARLAKATALPAGSGRNRKTPRLIAGLMPYADGPMTTDMRRALDERHELIEQRADAVLDAALADKEPWTTRLGEQLTDKREAKRWRRNARIIAAYRDRYQITTATPLGPDPETTAQKIDHARAEAALWRTRAIATRKGPDSRERPPVEHDQVGPRL